MQFSKRRILLISSNSSDRGGGERYLVYLTEGLRLLDHEVHVLLSSVSYMDGWASDLVNAGATVKRLPLVGLRDRPLRFLQSIGDRQQQQKIAEFCRQLMPDAILVNQQYDEDGLDYIAGALMADIAPVGGTIHMPMTAEKNQRPFGRLRGYGLQNWYRQHPYERIFVSQGGQSEFCHYYNQLSSIGKVVHCGFFRGQTASGSGDRFMVKPLCQPVVGFVGQFSTQKNLHLLVDSWQWLRQQGIHTKLMLVGDGMERATLEQRLMDLSSDDHDDDWQITGWQPNPEQYLSQVDVYAMTSHFEGLPLALLEALGSGLPAVVTNFNGAADAAQQAPWLTIVQEPSPAAFGAALKQSLQNMSALKEQAMAGKAAFQEYFSTRRMAQDTLLALGVS